MVFVYILLVVSAIIKRTFYVLKQEDLKPKIDTCEHYVVC